MDSLKNFFKTVKLHSYMAAVMLIIFGILFVAYPMDAARLVCYFAGAVMIIWGAVKIISWGVTELHVIGSYSLVAGIALLAFGIFIVAYPDSIVGVITLAFGIALIVDSTVKIQQALDMARLKIKGWWMSLIIAAITLALGILILCDPFSGAEAFIIVFGVSLIADGVLDFLSLVYFTCKVKKYIPRPDKDGNKKDTAEAKTRKDDKKDNGDDNVIDI